MASSAFTLWRRLLLAPEAGALIGLVATFLFFALVAGNQGFLTLQGTVNYLEVAAQLGILATGVALLMIAGEFDLSVGSMIGAAGMVFALGVQVFGLPPWASILLAFGVAALVGLANGYLILKTGLPSFIVTLATLYILRGATIAITREITSVTRFSGLAEPALNDPVARLFMGTLWGLPVSVWWWVGLTLFLSYVLLRTRWGNWIFAAGGDPVAARNSGVPVASVKLLLFVLTAILATLLSLIQVLNTGSADVLRGQTKELEAIAAAVIGGCLLTGGYGSVLGASLGALTLGMVQQGIFFTGINTDWYLTFLGGMLLGSVALNQFLRQKAREVWR
ncbi:ABC-type transporter, integral membrane subunit (plasmid) [Thermus thermophilus SG0.5JP17-16]|uniref:Xylose transport system permease protein XylH n=2 Tax=Thermus thermophilus TaxID=274 RepID=F6DJ44_THETG|nr:ABC transporter permease [Thermus thermophilus]AEG34441.1 ABC-type transporter, integral membrane subunit [Thermus thermophilus SG0.5JP17-16]